MFVYRATKKDFLDDVDNEVLVNKIKSGMESTGDNFSDSEETSWNNSLIEMAKVLNDPRIPCDCGIAIEYKIPRFPTRVDFMISGIDANNKEHIVIVELKQWEEVQIVEDKDAIVKTWLDNGIKEVSHPSYQALSYAVSIENYNKTVQDDEVSLHPCVYAHNYKNEDDCALQNKCYEEYVQKAPIFGKNQADKLADFIKDCIEVGDVTVEYPIFDKIENSENWQPSKKILESLKDFSKNKKFMLSSDQKEIYEDIKKIINNSTENNKNVVIVEGDSGTGKTVVALKLLFDYFLQGKNVCYVTENSEPRKFINYELGNCYQTLKNNPSFKSAYSVLHDDRCYDAIIVDEAHRLVKKWDNKTKNIENHIKPIISKSNCCVFFLDQCQPIGGNNIGTSYGVACTALMTNASGIHIHVYKLKSQFRCAGSDDYIAWVKYCLGMASEKPHDFNKNGYTFEICDSPNELEKIIKERNKEGRSRIVAGYCWNWDYTTRDNPYICDIKIGDWEKSWNLNKRRYCYLLDDESIDQVGSVYTVQGLELDYVGVIIGKDLIYDGGVKADKTARAESDNTFKNVQNEQKEKILIQNAYYTLMTRGTKGCYVYCCDSGLAEYWRGLLDD